MGTEDEHCEHLGTARRADFEGWEAQCSLNGPLGLSTVYCLREERLIHPGKLMIKFLITFQLLDIVF